MCAQSLLVKGGLHVFDSDELEAAAEKGTPILLVVVGHVYDVSNGKEFYEAGAGYGGFASGADASRAFLSADFDKDASDDLSGLNLAQCLGVHHWAKFYAESAKYHFVGMHEGRFYDEDGQATASRRAFDECVQKGLRVAEAARALVHARPKCERDRVSQSSTGRPAVRYTCRTPQVPRKISVPDMGERCVCIEVELTTTSALWERDDGISPQPYDGCNTGPSGSVCVLGGAN